MPPFVQPSFELIEAKSWATECVDQLISEIDDISFEPESPVVLATTAAYQPLAERANSAPPSRRRIKRPNNPIRRSFSLLETNLFHHNSSSARGRDASSMEQQKQQKAARTWSSASVYYRNLHHNSNWSSSSNGSNSSSSRSSSPALSASSSSSFNKKEREGRAIWQTTFQRYLLEETNTIPDKPSLSLSRFVMSELLSTEETYLDHLSIIKRIFMDPLMEAASAHPRPLASFKDVQTIFAYIPQLIMLSTSFLRRLHGAVEKGNDIGSAFCEHLDQFDVYISYAANYSKAQRCAANVRNIVCRHYVQEKTMNRMVLADYAIAPIQRITRYCLLLKDLKKHSSSSDPDCASLDRALKCMTALAHAMNNIQ
ncbi:Dbl homology domain-containing protein [Zychaea mexicana]|uniref:rho guanine nucleotide exchange factor n=1 Tax=Zychaea mexicana TaxID=64656 RepID=UPI0022FF27AA|nr:rho guanine nucleotide exchange factor [Zychaea mexicana]KAI9498486.1 Dbl homology domain-containing protein [Zychaea mexicana]